MERDTFRKRALLTAYVDTVSPWQALTGESTRYTAAGCSVDDLACQAEVAGAV